MVNLKTSIFLLSIFWCCTSCNIKIAQNYFALINSCSFEPKMHNELNERKDGCDSEKDCKYIHRLGPFPVSSKLYEAKVCLR